MKCTLCGHVFDEATAATGCRGCPLVNGCELIRCPKCGFETPAEPDWLKRLKKRINRRRDNDSERTS
jgi:rubredoxin